MTIALSPVRTPVVLPVAAAVTVGLFVLMNNLIDIGPVAPDPVQELPPIVIMFDIKPEEPRERMTIEELDPVAPPPPVQRLDVDIAPVEAVTSEVSWHLPPVEVAALNHSGGLVNIDRNPVPSVRVPPVYPPAALSRGLEGQCSMLFDITPQGTTTNVRALDCTSSLFERAAINSVSRWRYNPQMQDGQPTLFRGATTQIVFSVSE